MPEPRPPRRLIAEPTEGTPFASTAEAWFWTIGALEARRAGSPGRSERAPVRRPCEPDDIVRCLDRLYRSRQIGPDHARVLTVWGKERRSPNSCDGHALPARLWREALARLEAPLRAKGIVASNPAKEEYIP